jgi:hypothetical protein
MVIMTTLKLKRNETVKDTGQFLSKESNPTRNLSLAKISNI